LQAVRVCARTTFCYSAHRNLSAHTRNFKLVVLKIILGVEACGNSISKTGGANTKTVCYVINSENPVV